MGLTLIHCADLHFDTPFSGLDSPQKAEVRREELRQTFGKIVELTAKERADALLICGDLFDQKTASALTLRYIREKLEALSPTPVFISAGNHDPNTPGSYYQMLRWPENVHIFQEEIEQVECEGFDIYGASFRSWDEPASKLQGFRVRETDGIHIMAMHADIGGSYNPIRPQEIADSGLDYLALGHIHQYSGPMRYGRTTAVYPGCPEGRGFDELGEKGVVKTSIDQSGVQVEFIPVCSRQYHEVTVDVSGAKNYETLCGRIALAMNGSADDLYKIVLEGEAELPIQPEIILEKLPCYAARIKNKTKPKLDLDELKDVSSLRGIFVRKMLKQMECSDDKEQVRQALSYGMEALSGEKVKLP